MNLAVHFPWKMTFCGCRMQWNLQLCSLKSQGCWTEFFLMATEISLILQGCGPLWPWPLLSQQRRRDKKFLTHVTFSLEAEVFLEFLDISFTCDNALPWLSDLRLSFRLFWRSFVSVSKTFSILPFFCARQRRRRDFLWRKWDTLREFELSSNFVVRQIKPPTGSPT